MDLGSSGEQMERHFFGGEMQQTCRHAWVAERDGEGVVAFAAVEEFRRSPVLGSGGPWNASSTVPEEGTVGAHFEEVSQRIQDLAPKTPSTVGQVWPVLYLAALL